MREQMISKVVDARQTQERVILWMMCGHKVSLIWKQIIALNYFPMVGDGHACPFCPDPPPPVREKTPRELWRDAGEP